MTHRALCHLVPGRRDPGVTREAGSATASLAWGAQAVAAACLAIGVSEWRAANPAPALTAVIQPLGSVWTGKLYV